jgi:DNA-binding response OmpR family regulator
LLAILYHNKGRLVPHSHLCRIIGHKSARPSQLHILRQYVSWAKRALRGYHVPLTIAAAKGIGYALCKIKDGRP